MPRRRILVLFTVILAAFLAVEARLFYLQVVQGAYYRDYADRQRVGLLPLDCVRARILSRDGAVLAQDELAFDVAVVIGRLDPAKERRLRRPLRRLFYVPRRQKLIRIREARWDVVAEPLEDGSTRLAVNASSKLEVEVRDDDDRPMVRVVDRRLEHPLRLPAYLVRSVTRLAELTGTPRDELIAEVLETAMNVARLHTPVSAPVPIIKGVGYDVVAAVETRPENFRGFQIEIRYERRAPAGPLAPHLVGHVSAFRPEDVEAAVEKHPGWPGRAYFLTLRAGRTGIERAMDGILRGEFGTECIERDHLNRRQRVLTDAPATPGRDVVLTIDSRLQKLVERAMAEPDYPGATGPAVGAAVFLDVRTGAILAVASSPTYDPACFRDQERYRATREDTNAPLFDRAFHGRLPLGSVFKIVTALAALENDCVPASVICTGAIRFGRRGRVFRCHRTHGQVELVTAIKKSCNVFFYRTGQQVGDRALIRMAHRLGLGRKTGVRVPGESAGNLPRTAPGGELLNLSIGQGELLVTPLQVARMVAVVANGGVLVPPRVIEELRPFEDDEAEGRLPHDPRRPVRLAISKASLDLVRLGLYKVVNEPGGTGHRAFGGFDRGFAVCGKTSTAQRRARRNGQAVRDNVGWFAGYAPHKKPRVAFAIAVERLTRLGGGSTAGYIGRQIFDQIPLDLVGVPDADEEVRE